MLLVITAGLLVSLAVPALASASGCRDRDGNLLPRPASDEAYVDAWLEDYFTS